MARKPVTQDAIYNMKNVGVEKAASEFDRLAASSKNAASGIDVLAKSTEVQEKAITRVGSKQDSLINKYDKLAKVSGELARAQAVLGAAMDKGIAKPELVKVVSDLERHYKSLSTVMNDNSLDFGKRIKAWNEETNSFTGRLNNWSRAQAEVNKGVEKTAKSAKLAGYEWANLSAQFQDVFVMLGSGASPITTGLQQGPQILEVMKRSAGGVSGALAEVGKTALSVATHPLTILAGALTTAAIAAYKFEEQNIALDRSLNGVGRASGMTSSALRTTALSNSGGLGVTDSINTAALFAGSGIAGRNIGGLLGSTRRFANAFGLDIQDAGREIASIVSDQSLGEMEKRFGAIDAATKEMVRNLRESGNYVEAQAVIAARLNEEIGKAKDTSSELAKIWDGIRNWATTPLFGLGPQISQLRNGPNIQQQLAAARGDYFNLRAQRGANESMFPGEAAALERVSRLEKQIADERQRAADAARNIERNQLSSDAADLARRVRPEAFARGDLSRQRDMLAKALGDPEVVRKMGEAAAGASAALEDLNGKLATFQTEAEKQAEDSRLTLAEARARTKEEKDYVAIERARIQVRRQTGNEAQAELAAQTERNRIEAEHQKLVEASIQDGQLAIRETQARTYAQREAIAMDRAWIQVFRESGDVLRANIAAENERQRLLADATRKAEDRVRGARNDLELIGLTPYEAEKKRIQQESQRFREENVPGATAPVTRGFQDVAIAAERAAAALNKVAGGAYAPAASPSASSLPFFASGGSKSDPRGLGSYIRAVAQKYGIDPDIAMRVARSEGLGQFVGDQGTSFGAFQLHIGGRAGGKLAVGGLGDSFRRSTGLDPSNPANERATIDYALSVAAKQGWGPWYGAAKVGIHGFDGIGGTPRMASAAQAATPRTVANDNLVKVDSSGIKKLADENDRLRNAAADRQYLVQPYIDLNKELDANRRLMDERSRVFQMSSRDIDEATKRQELMNDALRQTGQILPAQQAEIDAYAKKWADVEEQERRFIDRQRRVVEGLDFIRDSGRDALGGLASGLIHGESKARLLEDTLGRIGDRLIAMLADQAIEQLFGKMGSGLGNSGILGGLLGGLGGILGIGGSASPLASAMSPAASRMPAPANNNAAPVTVNLIGAPAGAKVNETTDSKGGRRLDVIFDERVAAAMASPKGREAMGAGYGARTLIARR